MGVALMIEKSELFWPENRGHEQQNEYTYSYLGSLLLSLSSWAACFSRRLSHSSSLSHSGTTLEPSVARVWGEVDV